MKKRADKQKQKSVEIKKTNNSSMNLLTSILLIVYGFVTVLTPNWMAFDSNAPKFFTFAILNLIVCGLVFFIKDFRIKNTNLFGFFTNKIGIAYTVIIVFSLLSFIKVINVEEAILHFFKVFTAFSAAWMVAVLIIYNPKSVHALAVAMTALLIFDAFRTFGGVADIVKGIGNVINIKGSYSNKNILTSAIFIKIPFAVWLFYFKRDWQRIMGGIGILLASAAIFFMSTRAFYLATIITFVVLLIYAVLNYVVLKNKKTVVKAGSHLFFLLLAFGVFSFVQHYMYPKENRTDTSFAARLSTITDEENQSNNLRLTAWKTSLEMIEKDPLLGVGIGNWKVRYLEYENSYSPHYIYMYKNHNDFLEIPAETGVISGLAFVAIFILIAYYFLTATYKRKDPEQEKWFFLPFFGLFAYSFDAFFNFPQDCPEIQSLFAIYVGMAVAFGVIYFSKSKTEKTNAKSLPAELVVLLAILAIVVNFADVVVQKMYFDSSKIQRMVKEEQKKVRKTKSSADYLIENYPPIPNLTAVAEPIDVEKARYLIDEKKFERAREILSTIDYSPWDGRPEYFMAVSYFMDTDKNYDSIYKYANKARKVKPNFFGNTNLETYALNNMGKEQESMMLWKEFLQGNKKEPQAWNALAFLQEKNNQLKEAKATMDSAFVYLPNDKTIESNRNKIATKVQMGEYMPLYDQAKQAYTKRDHAKAITLFNQFINKVPGHVEAHGLRAVSYYQAGKYKQALEDMAKQESLGATLTSSMDNIRASCFYMLGDRANAKKYYEKAWKAGNKDAKTNLDRLTF